MSEEEKNIPSEETTQPTPLSLEGGTTQLDLPVKPPAAKPATNVRFNKPGLIAGIMSTPKETGATNPSEEPQPSTSGSGAGAKPPIDTAEIITRLGGEEPGDRSSKGPPPTPEESNDTAGMIIDGFNALFLIGIQAWSKNPHHEDYEVETTEKTKLKKYLSSIFFKAEKKINPIWLFVGLLLITYVPKLQAAWAHRKMVREQREKDKPETIILKPSKKRHRRHRDNDDDGEFTHAEEIR